jgi:hypothetical protein
MGTKSKWLKGKLTFWNNAVVDANVAIYTTTLTSIPPYGLRVLNNVAAQKFVLSGPPVIGQEIEIVCNSTVATSVSVSTVAGGPTIAKKPGSTGKAVLVTAAGTGVGHGAMTGCATLRGITTSQWALVKGFSLGDGGCTVTTAL